MLSRIKSIARQRQFALFTRPYELNIWGLRSKEVRANRFDDEIHVFYNVNEGSGKPRWNYNIYRATTDPGTYWLENPMQPQGTAILEGNRQYLNAYRIGLHLGKYKALVQRRPVTILRDYDRDVVLDFFNGKRSSGMFGINIHRATTNGTKKYIDRDSAGCQVFANYSDYQQFLQLCDDHRNRYGNQFSYTLIDFRSIRRENLRRIAMGSATAAAGLIGYVLWDE